MCHHIIYGDDLEPIYTIHVLTAVCFPIRISLGWGVNILHTNIIVIIRVVLFGSQSNGQI